MLCHILSGIFADISFRIFRLSAFDALTNKAVVTMLSVVERAVRPVFAGSILILSMAQPDDYSLESTRNEADRLLAELDRKPTSLGTRTGFSSPISGTSEKSSLQMGQSSVPMSWLVLSSLVFGAMVSALTMALVLKQPERPQANSGTSPRTADPTTVLNTDSSSSNLSQTLASPPQRGVSSNVQNPESQTSSAPATEAWGPASVYKFGRIPDSTYPDSCAFSQTNSAGQTITSRFNVDYWACRDEGGNQTDGYKVAWADGKRTTYTFQPGGEGSIVGTNNLTYPIRWRNSNRNGSNVVIISHSDGATSWIPGQVN